MFSPFHRTFRLTPVAPMPMREQVSRGFLFAAFILLVASGFLLCFCWQFYLAVAVCSILSFRFGVRQQRLVAVALFVVAVIAFAVGYRQERPHHPSAPPNNAQRTGHRG
jgi:hypothetical protein